MKQELDHQIKLLKFCGILERGSAQWTEVIMFYQSFIIFSSICTTVMLGTFMTRNYLNVMEVAECIAPFVSCTFTLIKFAFLITHAQGIFDMIKEIKKMNGKCKLGLNIQVLIDAVRRSLGFDMKISS